MLILRTLENDYLLRALGQGAFGEVYQGILKSKSDSAEVNVAVKTLPELSTNQGLPAFSFILSSSFSSLGQWVSYKIRIMNEYFCLFSKN